MSNKKTINFPCQQQISPCRYKVLDKCEAQAFNVHIIILKGFIYDGLSVPFMFWWFQSPFTGLSTIGGLFHDALYRTRLVGKIKADIVFLCLMWRCYSFYYGKFHVLSFLGYIKSFIIFLVVLLFGWFAYYKPFNLLTGKGRNKNKKEIFKNMLYVKVERTDKDEQYRL